jgi:hypothetical protein
VFLFVKMGIELIIGKGDFGGKGRWLSVAERAGIKIPRTAIITTDVHDSVSSVVRDEHGIPLIDSIGDDFDRELKELVRMFGDVPVAVRSSATSEDSFQCTSAGIYDTLFRNLGDPDWAVSSLKRDSIPLIILSTYHDNAVAYRKKMGLPEPRMAIVVQEIIGDVDRYNRLRLHMDAFHPNMSGYYNTMFSEKNILAVVHGLGTRAVRGDKVPIFNIDPKTNAIISSHTSQDGLDYYCLYTHSHKNLRTHPSEIGLLEARRISDMLHSIDDRFRKEGHIPASYGSDIEYAVRHPEDEEPFFLQGRPVPKIYQKLVIPRNSIVRSSAMHGFGQKSFSTVVDVRNCYEWDGGLTQINENIKDYLLLLGPYQLSKPSKMMTRAIDYHNFYNAGGVLVDGPAGVYLSGAEHFALVCHDTDILFIEGELSAKGKAYLGPVPENHKAVVREKELLMMVDSNSDAGGLFIS